MGLSIKQLDRVKFLRASMVYDAISGNYKSYKEARKEYASLAIQDFDTVRKLKTPSASAPLFSKPALNMLIVHIKDLFRRKTPDEKTFKKMAQECVRQENIRKLNEQI